MLKSQSKKPCCKCAHHFSPHQHSELNENTLRELLNILKSGAMPSVEGPFPYQSGIQTRKGTECNLEIPPLSSTKPPPLHMGDPGDFIDYFETSYKAEADPSKEIEDLFLSDSSERHDIVASPRPLNEQTEASTLLKNLHSTISPFDELSDKNSPLYTISNEKDDPVIQHKLNDCKKNTNDKPESHNIIGNSDSMENEIDMSDFIRQSVKHSGSLAFARFVMVTLKTAFEKNDAVLDDINDDHKSKIKTHLTENLIKENLQIKPKLKYISLLVESHNKAYNFKGLNLEESNRIRGILKQEILTLSNHPNFLEIFMKQSDFAKRYKRCKKVPINLRRQVISETLNQYIEELVDHSNLKGTIKLSYKPFLMLNNRSFGDRKPIKGPIDNQDELFEIIEKKRKL